jgi:hypothetical protein
MRVMKLPRLTPIGCVVLFAGGALAAPLPPELRSPVAALRAVAAEGRGNVAASAAFQQVVRADAAAIPALLEAMDGANDFALNWLRSAIETVAQRDPAGVKAALGSVERFLRDRQHHPRARRLAFELMARADAAQAHALLPAFLNDPSNELRREAVQQLADSAAAKAKSGDKAAATAGYQQALAAAREADQIEAIAKTLGELGDKVDLQKTFGWITRWKVIGPFDNAGGAGFEKAFAPELGIDYAAEADGLNGKVRWRDYESKSEYGLVDFNQPLTALKSVTGYAAAEFWSDSARPVELRLGCKNGWKVWLNGKPLFGRDEYHRGMEIDQYRLAAQLQPGKNVILVKCLQNEQTEDWTKEWEFQIRVTDAQGTPIASAK